MRSIVDQRRRSPHRLVDQFGMQDVVASARFEELARTQLRHLLARVATRMSA
ncbi:MAG: hypothetical protein HC936_18570 [Leptolyngbyaceae cyanobacterium SU_3_3]|nr:hypothetical protein [Leptolyngbyaceae cyanobacterium SU_3_3]